MIGRKAALPRREQHLSKPCSWERSACGIDSLAPDTPLPAPRHSWCKSGGRGSILPLIQTMEGMFSFGGGTPAPAPTSPVPPPRGAPQGAFPKRGSPCCPSPPNALSHLPSQLRCSRQQTSSGRPSRGTDVIGMEPLRATPSLGLRCPDQLETTSARSAAFPGELILRFTAEHETFPSGHLLFYYRAMKMLRIGYISSAWLVQTQPRSPPGVWSPSQRCSFQLC